MNETARRGVVRLDWRVTAFAGHLLVLGAFAVVATALAPGPVTVIGAVTMLFLVALVLADPRPNTIEVSIRPSSSRCTVGDVVRYQVAWSSARPLHGTAQLAAASLVEPAGRQPWQLSAGPEHSFDLRPTGWRVGSPGTLRVRLVSRYGSWSASPGLVLPDLVVHPRPERQPGVYAPAQQLSQLGVHVGRARGSGTEFAEVREYAAGDPLRDVNWRASARTGGLMVSQRYRDQAADVVILLDHLGVHGAYDPRLTDAAVRGGAAVARAYLHAGDRVGLVLYGSVIRWIPPGQGQAQQLRLLDQIVAPPAVSSYLDPELARIPAAALPARAIVFCFSPLLDGRMVSAIGGLTARGHRLVVVDLAGTEPQRWPSTVSRTTQQVWREHRVLLRTRLSESGAMVVDDVNSVPAAVRLMTRRGVA